MTCNSAFESSKNFTSKKTLQHKHTFAKNGKKRDNQIFCANKFFIAQKRWSNGQLENVVLFLGGEVQKSLNMKYDFKLRTFSVL